MNTLDGKLLVDRGRFLLYETRRVVVPFIMEINFSSKVYSSSLVKGSPLSYTSLEEVISSPQYGYRYLIKDWCYLFYFVMSIGIATYSIIMNVALVIKAT